MPFKESSKQIAVIDIGSNSVRLVVYDANTRTPNVLFNEKMLCGLAKGMNQTGKLNPEGVILAINTITRFIKLTKIMQVKKVCIVATSAVRDANDGKLFVKKVQKLLKVKIDVLSGETEAQYAGYGVISAINNCLGVVGDLGGGSLELIAVNHDKISKGYSFPIGPLRVDVTAKDARRDYLAAVDSCFMQFPFHKLNDKSFYAVGGAFRNIAKIHAARKNYPLKIIHNFVVDAKDLYATLEVIAKMTPASLQKMSHISKKRLNFLPFAALVAMRIIETGKPKDFVFSATGIREGLLFSKLEPEIRSLDPLITGSTEMIRRALRSAEYGFDLAEWVKPILSSLHKIEPRLLLAACILSEISCFENTEYKAELAYRRILDSSLLGVSHKERLFLAKSLYCRYNTHPDEEILAAMEPLLDASSAKRAHILGLAMRVARTISASHPEILKQMPIKLTKNHVVLTLKGGYGALDSEILDKRMKDLAIALGLKPKVKVK